MTALTLKGITLARAGTPTYSPTLTVQRVVSEALSSGHKVLVSSSIVKTHASSGQRFPRVLCMKNSRGVPKRGYIESEAAIVEITPWPAGDVYIFVVEK